jgi:hypothetical protein
MYGGKVQGARVRALMSLCLLAGMMGPAHAADVDGSWAGDMNTEGGGAGGLEIVLARAAPGWTARVKLRPELQVLTPAVQAAAIEGDVLALTAEAGPVQLKIAGRFNGDRLVGTVQGWQAGQPSLRGTFQLTRGGKMPLPPPPAPPGSGQQADPAFNTKVERPAFPENGPRVLFDEAHHNFHTAEGRYKPFADLIASDGFQVVPNRQPLTADRLSGFRILVTANALGAERLDAPEASQAAFSDAECDAVRDWVRGGGALLLITDHAPTGAANQSLASRFRVDMSKGTTIDSQNYDREGNDDGAIVYSKDNGGLLDHPITRGRGGPERVKRVMTFVGQSLKGPAGSVPFLRLSRAAQDVDPEGSARRPAGGRAQGIALRHGKGRVVILGEAAMLSAQVLGPQRRSFGMNRPDIDNRQLALNLMRWLAGTLK